MSPTPPPAELTDRVSREFALTCDAEGRVTWLDVRARRILALEPGQPVGQRVVPGAEEKLQHLLRAAQDRSLECWEVPFALDGKPVTVSFCASPYSGGALLLGHVVPDALSKALVQLNGSIQEVVDLNRQILTQKKELEQRHAEALRLHRELEDSHQGVLTLHAELADRAGELHQNSEIKGRLLSNVSHEFRTPLHSILGLTQLLTEGADGVLNAEQRKQVGFIRGSAEELLQLVNDLLDLSKAEAGKAVVRMERFELGEFFRSMRGMLRPLLPANAPVEMVFEEPAAPLMLETDKPKLSQILRNVVSNAIKFTERGEIRISAQAGAEGRLEIQVRDTGIGIAPGDQERIFEEFGQIDSPLQQRVKGTGLGLPLSRRLAELLGGSLTVESAPGEGSTFTLTIPVEHAEVREMNEIVQRSRQQPAGPASILVVEDDRKTLFIYEKYLVMAGFHVLPARSVAEARELVKTSRPAAVVLDVMLEGETSWGFLAELKRDPETHDIPVLVVTVTNREQKARALGADEFWLKPINQESLLRRLRSITGQSAPPRVLVIDDDERSRYLIRKHLEGTPYQLLEAATGAEGVALAQEMGPHVILLDFLLEDITAFDVLDDLKADPRTRPIPVIVITSLVLDVVQKQRLLQEAESVISKQALSRELALNRIRDALRKAGVRAQPRL